MDMHVSDRNGIRIAATLIGLVCATTVSAQQFETRSQDPSVQAASCAAVQWNEDMLASYPRIAEGCQDVLISEGRKWARFSADLVRTNRNGLVTLDFKNRQGRSIGELTLMPAPEQRVSIDGRDFRFSELARGQQLNLYVPEGMYGVALQPGVEPEQLVQILPEGAPAAQLAQTERAPARTAQRLPNTAGPLPLLALGGLLLLLTGQGLSLRRRWFARSG